MKKRCQAEMWDHAGFRRLQCSRSGGTTLIVGPTTLHFCGQHRKKALTKGIFVTNSLRPGTWFSASAFAAAPNSDQSTTSQGGS